MIEITWKDELYEDLMELAEYIAFQNRDFICTTCLESLDRIKAIALNYYGSREYREMSDMIDSVMEEEDYE